LEVGIIPNHTITSTMPRRIWSRVICHVGPALDGGPAGTLHDLESACPDAALSSCVGKHRTGFFFPIVDVQSFNHDEKNVNVVRRGFRYSIIVICPAQVSMLRLDQAEYPDQDKGACGGITHGGACAGGLPRPG